MKKIPILILSFNRPEYVKQAIEAVRAYQPGKLYLACDGPRQEKEGEQGKVIATQRAMLDAIEWSCDVKTLFRDVNLGCAQAVYEAISWFFQHEEYGIIIEDDVLIGQDFFKMCEDLLPRYAKQEKIMEISAENHSGRTDNNNTYVYSQHFLCWGWATWRRAWAKMDMEMKAAPKIKTGYLIKRLGLFRGLMMKRYFMLGYFHLDTFSSWATRWYLSILAHDGLVIIPGINLAVNIGFEEGTHYSGKKSQPYSELEIGNIEWPLEYNDSLKPDKVQKTYDSRDFLRIKMIGIKKRLGLWIM